MNPGELNIRPRRRITCFIFREIIPRLFPSFLPLLLNIIWTAVLRFRVMITFLLMIIPFVTRRFLQSWWV